MHQDLGWVLVGRSEGAVGVSGVQTGPVHVAVPDACLFQHFLETVHTHVWPFHVLQELLGVKAGPLESRFTSENGKANAIRINCTFVVRLKSHLILRWCCKQLGNSVLIMGKIYVLPKLLKEIRAQNICRMLLVWYTLKCFMGEEKIPTMQSKVLNSISSSALVYGSLTHSSLFLSEAFCVSFRPQWMCLTRLGLLFPTSQPEHSKNTHTHTQTLWCYTFTHGQNPHYACPDGSATHYIHVYTHVDAKVCWVLL